ncbi:Gfo/Idh/MocA family protein [Streptomyces sp. NPDC021115]|uniref:Gfo/Idh/MocA family protein n=1 Tax=Streptomyces sp. NPDC021115 TaxID=3365115 RepID=UPI00378FE121
MVGAGMIGAIHRRAAALAGARITGVLASTPARSARVAEEWAVPAYPSLDALLDDDSVDVVHICSPNATHAPYALRALDAGKHVVCEKPLAVSVADAERMAETARRSGLVAAVPFVYRYHPLVREIRARRIDGEFGGWHLIHGSYLQDWMLSPQASGWRVDPVAGGPSRAFADIGSHWCDLVEWVSGERFAEVTASMSVAVDKRPAAGAGTFAADSSDGEPSAGAEPSASEEYMDVRTEDCAALLLRTASGVLASTTVSQVSAGRKNRLWFELDGARASAVFDQENPETIWLGGEDGARVVSRDPGRGSAEQRRLSVLPPGHPQGYAQCFEAFVADAYAAIGGDRPEGLPTFDDGLRAARITEAVLRSSRNGSWTEV